MNFIFTDTLSFIDLFVMCRLVSEINGSRTHSSGNNLLCIVNQHSMHSLQHSMLANKLGLPHSCRDWNV